MEENSRSIPCNTTSGMSYFCLYFKVQISFLSFLIHKNLASCYTLTSLLSSVWINHCSSCYNTPDSCILYQCCGQRTARTSLRSASHRSGSRTSGRTVHSCGYSSEIRLYIGSRAAYVQTRICRPVMQS